MEEYAYAGMNDAQEVEYSDSAERTAERLVVRPPVPLFDGGRVYGTSPLIISELWGMRGMYRCLCTSRYPPVLL